MFNFQNKLKTIIYCFVLLVCGALLGFAIAVYGNHLGKNSHDQRPVVAVLNPVSNIEQTSTIRMTVAGILVEQILLNKNYRVVNTEDHTPKEYGYTKSGSVSSGETRLSKTLAADIICTSTLMREEEGFFIACSFTDAITNEVLATATELVPTDSPEEIKSSIERAANKMLGGLKPKKLERNIEKQHATL